MDGLHGMTISNILEKVDLLDFIIDEDGNNENQKEAVTSNVVTSVKAVVMNASDPTSAYLGPKLWNNPISPEDTPGEGSSSEMMAGILEPASLASDVVDVKPLIRPSPSIIGPTRRDTVKIEPNIHSGANEFLYVESKRARLDVDREKEKRKRKLEVQLDFAPEDIAWTPGLEFDPNTRALDLELRPQPITKKRKKNSVSEDLKDDKYWEKRNKNKEATRRSREARRLKENQIVLRAAYLEKENRVLKQVNAHPFQ